MVMLNINIEIIAILIPAACTGILMVGNLLFFYIYLRRKNNLHLSLLIVGLFSFLYAGIHLLNLIANEIFSYYAASQILYRLEHAAVAFFLFCIPYFLTYFLDLKPQWQNINKAISFTGLVVACIVLNIAILYPDLLILITKQSVLSYASSVQFTHGRPGIVSQIRDMLMGALMVYGVICFIIDMVWNRRLQYVILPFTGFLFVSIFALDDIVHMHTASYTGMFSDLHFSRATIGITIFMLSSMASVIKIYIDQSDKVEQTLRELGSAYKMLYRREERFQQLEDSIQEVFMLIDYQNNIMLYISSSYERITGVKLKNIYELPGAWIDYIHPDDRKAVLEAFMPANIKGRFDVVFRFIRPDGGVRWLSLRVTPVRDRNDALFRLACVVEDITERKKSEDELTFIAYNDLLTGLPNRRSFFDRLRETLYHAPRGEGKKSKAIIIIDIDRFKDINDIFGQERGDIIIREMASRLRLCLRESDYISRIGGDKFSVLLNTVSEDIDAAVVARKIIGIMSSPFVIEGREIFVNLKMGISIFPRDGADSDDLIKSAEMALQVAKGQNVQYQFYNDEMNLRSQERMTIESNLRHAISRNQLTLHYQPLVNREGMIIGMEALLRWNHPDLGYIPPDKFIPIAESTGMIVEIGNWIFQTACRQKKLWEDIGFRDIKLSINLSPKQLMDDKLVESVTGALKENGLDSQYLELEITESCLMDHPEVAVGKINDLYNLGINFSLDDFGTGYSSLSYLKRFKIDNLKVDKSFIMDIKIDVNNTEITKAIIAMAHSLGLQVTAEGVETVEQLEFLKQHHCDKLQGYLFSRPLPADEITSVLKKGLYIHIG
jgi:diguanylate cyclase (GGDEF)-like protein/PAS domain S-box-containing protein